MEPKTVGAHVGIFCRGFLIVFLTAFNVASISQRHFGQAFIGGFAISYVWWGNSRGAAHSDLRWARLLYATGAAVGTISGMLASLWG